MRGVCVLELRDAALEQQARVGVEPVRLEVREPERRVGGGAIGQFAAERRTSVSSSRRVGSTSGGAHAVASTSPSAQIERPTWSPTCGLSSHRRS